jgi:hypothetical protein
MPEETLLPDPTYPSKLEKFGHEPHAAFSDYTAINKQIYVRPSDSPSRESIPSSSPTIIILYAWGDSNPKHVVKYADGYRALFPQARTVVVFGPILKAITQTLPNRARDMAPVIDAAFGGSQDPEEHEKERVMITAMSNTGGINIASTLHAYYQRFRVPMPHQLLICDSTPGSTDFFPNAGRWSHAMALGLSQAIPLPFFIHQGMSLLFLGFLQGLCRVFRIQPASEFSVAAVNDIGPQGLSTLKAAKLYLYSKEDEIILWRDIEAHAAEAREKGFDVALEMFEGTSHCGHMKDHKEQYWGAIERRWREVAGK